MVFKACFAEGSIAMRFLLGLFQIISIEAPARGTCLRTVHFIKESRKGKKKKKKAQHPEGFEPMTFQFSDWQECANHYATITFPCGGE